MTDEPDPPPSGGGLQGWIERNRAKIWIWGIGILALGGVACMFLIVFVLIVTR